MGESDEAVHKGLGDAAAGEDVGKLGEAAADLAGGGAVAPAGIRQVPAGALYGLADRMDEVVHGSEERMMASSPSRAKTATQTGMAAGSSGMRQNA